MFRAAIALLLIAVLAAVLGFGGIAGEAAGLAKIVMLVALVLAIVGFFFGRGRRASLVALLGLGALAVPLPAAADVAETAEVTRTARGGATFGLDLGFGRLGCSDRYDNDCGGGGPIEAGGLAIHGGAMLTPRLAVLGDLWAMAHTEDDWTVSQGILSADVRFWPVRRFWIEGGIGVARAAISYDGAVHVEGHSEIVPALVAALGVEVISTPGFGLDIQLRGGTGLYDDDLRVYNLSLGVGASWY